MLKEDLLRNFYVKIKVKSCLIRANPDMRILVIVLINFKSKLYFKLLAF